MSVDRNEVEAMSRGGETGHDADAAVHSMPKSAIGVEAQPRLAKPESAPAYPAEGKTRRNTSDNENRVVSRHATVQQVPVEKPENEEQAANEYTHYSNLFDNPPPSIPTVDQYIFDENIMYGAISKRRQGKALPVNPSGGGVQELGGVSWADARLSTGGVDQVETHVDPQDLLYADEDIDKVHDRF